MTVFGFAEERACFQLVLYPVSRVPVGFGIPFGMIRSRYALSGARPPNLSACTTKFAAFDAANC